MVDDVTKQLNDINKSGKDDTQPNNDLNSTNMKPQQNSSNAVQKNMNDTKKDLQKNSDENATPINSNKKGVEPIQINQDPDSNDKEEFVFEELTDLEQKIKATEGMPEDLVDKTEKMIKRLNRMAKLGHYSQDFDSISKYIEVVTSIPWSARSVDKLDLDHARKMLEKNHYGMESVKTRVLEYLASMILIKQRSDDPSEATAKSPVLLLVGLQGVGKTTIAISLAEALERKFIRIAMGGIGSPLALRGRSKVYPEAEPGEIVKGLIKAQVKNPVILLDEIEKASGDAGLRSDIMAILLEILDPNQNHSFKDHYVDYPINLSECLFMCSANNTGTLSAALMDRMEVIKMPSYTDEEKTVIARDYIFPGLKKKTGLREDELQIDPELWPKVVRPFGFDSGIRSLGRTLETICRKVAKEIVEGTSEKVYIDESNLKRYLPTY